MPGGSEELRLLLKGFNGRTGSRMSAVVTRSGGVVAAVLPEDVPADNFATMAATLLGALEVIYSATKGPSPQTVSVKTEAGNLFVRVVTPKTFFVALADGNIPDMDKAVEEAAVRARGLLPKTP